MMTTEQSKPIMSVNKDGIKEWRLNGQLHREDGPAVEHADGFKAWRIDGKFHRTDGPAIEHPNGYKAWWIDGKRHRTDGPAIEHTNGDKSWYINGKLHRTDGPAIEHPNGYKAWYINDKQLTEKEFNVITKPPGSTMTVDAYGNKKWRNMDGKYHRTDGPAIEHANGDKSWYINGKLHRTDGPAVEHISGYKAWCIDGKLHCDDGPAVVCASGYKAWYINDKQLTEEEFMAATKQQESTMTVNEDGDKEWRNASGQLHRIDSPAVEYFNGYKEWWIDGKLHRTDGPAVEYADGGKQWFIDSKCHRLDGPAVESIDGYKAWWVDGKFHRTDGPAVEYPDGGKFWYINGKQLTEKEFNATLSMSTTTQEQFNKMVDEDAAKAIKHYEVYGRVKSVNKLTTKTTSANGVVTKTCFETIRYFKD